MNEWKTALKRTAMAGIVAAGLMSGCDNAGQGAVSGASMGALSGLAIGSLSGNAGRGAAIGAVAGGAGGAVLGDQNRRSRENAQTARQPVPVAPPPPPAASPAPAPEMSNWDRDRLQLAKFARPWRVSGWETVDGRRRFVSGTATGQVDSTFFVRLDMVITDELSGNINRGNVVFASEPGRGLTLNSRFDSSPTAVAFAGSVNAAGDLFTLNEIAPGFGPNGRQVVIRFLTPDNFVADTTNRRTGEQSSSLSFTSVR
jgi:hypothetical protein